MLSQIQEYQWRYENTKYNDEYDKFINIKPLRSAHSHSSFWPASTVSDDENDAKSCYTYKTAIRAESPVYEPAYEPKSTYKYETTNEKKYFNSSYDDKRNSYSYRHNEKDVYDKKSRNNDRSRSVSPYKKYFNDSDDDWFKRKKEDEEEYYERKLKNYDTRYTEYFRNTKNPKPKHKLPQPKIPYAVRQEIARKELVKQRQDDISKGVIPRPYTREEFDMFSREMALKLRIGHINKGYQAVAAPPVQSRRLKLFSLTKPSVISNKINQITSEVTQYFVDLNINPFTKNKEGTSSSGAAYSGITRPPPPSQGNHIQNAQTNVINKPIDDANIQHHIQDIRNDDLLNIDTPVNGRCPFLSTAQISAFVKAAIHSSENPEEIAYLDPVYFYRKPGQTHYTNLVDNWHPERNKMLFMPYVESFHHRYFVYQRNNDSTGYADIYHYDPKGHPKSLETTMIPQHCRNKARQIVEEIEGRQVMLHWHEPYIPPVAQQPRNNGIDCGAHSASMQICQIHGREPFEIASYNIDEVRHYLQQALNDLLNNNEIPSTILKNHPWTYHQQNNGLQPIINAPDAMDTTLAPHMDKEISTFCKIYPKQPLKSNKTVSPEYLDIYARTLMESKKNCEVAITKATCFLKNDNQIDASCVYNYSSTTTKRFMVPFILEKEKGVACFFPEQNHEYFVLMPGDKSANCTPYVTSKACDIYEKITSHKAGRQCNYILPPDCFYGNGKEFDPVVPIATYMEMSAFNIRLKELKWFDVNDAKNKLHNFFFKTIQKQEFRTDLFKESPLISSKFLKEKAIDKTAVKSSTTSAQPQLITLTPQAANGQRVNENDRSELDRTIIETLHAVNMEISRNEVRAVQHRYRHSGNPITEDADAGEDVVDSLYMLMLPSLKNSRCAYYKAAVFHAEFQFEALLNYAEGFTTHISFINTEGRHYRTFIYDIKNNVLVHLNSLGHTAGHPPEIRKQCYRLIQRFNGKTPTNTYAFPQLQSSFYQTDSINCAFFALGYTEYFGKGYYLPNVAFSITPYKLRCRNMIQQALQLQPDETLPLNILNYVPVLSGPAKAAIPQPQTPKTPTLPKFAPRASSQTPRKRKSTKISESAKRSPSTSAPKQSPFNQANLRSHLSPLKLLPMARPSSKPEKNTCSNNVAKASSDNGELISIQNFNANMNNNQQSIQQLVSPMHTTPATSPIKVQTVTSTPLNKSIPISHVTPNLKSSSPTPQTPQNILSTPIQDGFSLNNNSNNSISSAPFTTPARNNVSEMQSPSTPEDLKRRLAAARSKQHREKFNSPNPSPLRESPRIALKRKCQDNLTPNALQQNGYRFLDIKNLPLNEVQQQFLQAIDFNKATHSFAKAIEVLLKISNLNITLDNEPVQNFINVIPDSRKAAWGKETERRKNDIIERKDIQQHDLICDNLNYIIDAINTSPLMVEQIQHYHEVSQHDPAITTLGFLYDALHDRPNITAEIVNQFIHEITTKINKVKQMQNLIWDAFLPIRKKLHNMIHKRISGTPGTDDYYNRLILGYSFHPVSRRDTTQHPIVNTLFDQIFKNFTKTNAEGEYIFYHPGESCREMQNPEKCFPWIYHFEPINQSLTCDEENNHAAISTPVTTMPSENSNNNTSPNSDNMMFKSHEKLTEVEKAKSQLLSQIQEEKILDDRIAANDESFYFNAVRAKMCTQSCPKVDPKLGRLLYESIHEITQCTSEDIVPCMAKFEKKCLPLIQYHGPCFQGLRTLLRKIRNFREVFGVMSKSVKCMAECNYTLLQDLTSSYRGIPEKVKRILKLADLPPPAVQSEDWAIQNYGALLDNFNNADSEIRDDICQTCHRITASTSINRINTNNDIILSNPNILHHNTEPHQDPDDGQDYYKICTFCKIDMANHLTPLFSTYNGFLVEQLPPELAILNEIEWALIKKIRPLMSFTFLQPNAGYHAHRMPHFSGIMLHILNPIEENFNYITTTLPSSDHMTINVKWNPDSPRLHLVRLDAMIRALEWLKVHNPFYSDITVNPNFTFTQECVTVESAETDMDVNDLIATAIQNESQEEQRAPNLFLTQRLLQNELTTPGSVLEHYTMGKMDMKDIQKIFDKNVDVKCFPELHPSGKFGIHYDRERTVRDAHYFKSRLNHYSRIFSDKAYIAFCKSFKDVKAVYGTVNASFRQIQGHVEKDKLIDCLNNGTYDPLVDRMLSATFKSIVGSYDYNHDQIQKCKTMVDYFGKFDIWLTFNPAEWDWENLQATIRSIHNIQPTENIDVNDWAKKDAPLFTQYFHNRMINFLRTVLLVKGGPFGQIIHNFRHYEWQGRGTTHCHGAYWLENPIQFDGTNEAEIIKRIDQCITVRIPHPVTEPRANEMVNRYQRHYCNDSCIKSISRNGTNKTYCRFGFPYQPSAYTHLNQKNGELLPGREYILKRDESERFINPYNMACLLGWKGNMDVQFTCGTDVSNIIQYIQQYLKHNEDAKKVQRENDKNFEHGMKFNQMLSVGFRHLNVKSVSITEAAHHILQLPMYMASCATKFISADPPNVRRHYLNRNLTIGKVTQDNIFAPSAIDMYSNRDSRLANYSLFNIETNFKLKIYNDSSYLDEEDEAQESQANESQHVDEELDDSPDIDTGISGAPINSLFLTREVRKRLMRYNGNPYYLSRYGVLHFASPVFCHADKEPNSTFDTGVDGAVYTLRNKALLGRFYLPVVPDFDYDKLEESYHRMLLLFKPFMNESEIHTIKDSFGEAWHQFIRNLIASDSVAADDIFRLTGPKMERLSTQVFLSQDKTLQQLKALHDIDAHTPTSDFNKIAKPFSRPVFEESKLDETIASLSHDEQAPLYHELMEIINAQETFDPSKKSKHPGQILLYVSGVAGTGKTLFVETITFSLYKKYGKCDNDHDNPVVIRAAPTSKAAEKMGGATIHSTFGIGRDTAGYIPLSNARRSELQAIFSKVKLLVLDEGSMIGNILFATIHLRCQEITTCTSKPFGGLNVLILGDLCQLPPVLDGPIYKPLNSLKVEKYFTGVGTGVNMWQQFNYSEFTKNQRQKGDNKFFDILGKFRIGIADEKDFNELKQRLIPSAINGSTDAAGQAEYFVEMLKHDDKAIALFPKRRQAIEFNTEVMKQLNLETINIWAQDSDKKPKTIENLVRPWQKSMYKKDQDTIDKTDINIENSINQQIQKPNTTEFEKAYSINDMEQEQLFKQLASDTAELPELLKVAINCRIMLTKNINDGKGLLNGATGFLRDVLGREKKTKDGTIEFKPEQLIVELDNSPNILHKINRDSTEFVVGKKKKVKVTRKQFPLIVSYGCTIHKCQGTDVDNALISLEGCFAPGQAYVALSRVRTLAGVHLASWDDKCMMVNEDVIAEYNRLRGAAGLALYPSAKERKQIRNSYYKDRNISREDSPLPVFPANSPQLNAQPIQHPSVSQEQEHSMDVNDDTAIQPSDNILPAILPIQQSTDVQRPSNDSALIKQVKNGEIDNLSLTNSEGNLSAINSTFQSMRVIPEIIQYINEHHKDSQQLNELYKICQNIGTEKLTDISTIGQFLPNFSNDVEMNPLIFIRWFLDQLDDDIKQQFTFDISDVYTCELCSNPTTNELKNNLFFQLDLPKMNNSSQSDRQTMSQLLKSLEVGKVPQMQCTKCKKLCKHSVIRKLSFPSLPQKQRYFITVLKRLNDQNEYINSTLITKHRSSEQRIANKDWYLMSAVQLPTDAIKSSTYTSFLKDNGLNGWIKIDGAANVTTSAKGPTNLERVYVMFYKETIKKH